MKNLFIFVADSLRYDYLPESIAEEGSAVRTLAPSLHTPVSFSSLLTARSPEKHRVRGFHRTLDSSFETVFDRFENGSYYDFEEDPVRTKVLKNMPDSRELDQLEEPFVFVERAMESHTPYNEMQHGNELSKVSDGKYTRSFSNSELQEKYSEGVKGVEEHFWNHVEKLKDMGVFEDTLIVFTSDHGELLGERINGKRRYAHGHPISRLLVEVPTVFINADVEAESMRFIDIVETSLRILGKKGLDQEGIDARTGEVREGKVVFDGYSSFSQDWIFDGEWRPESELYWRWSILREDIRVLSKKWIGKEFFSRPGEPGIVSGIDF